MDILQVNQHNTMANPWIQFYEQSRDAIVDQRKQELELRNQAIEAANRAQKQREYAQLAQAATSAATTFAGAMKQQKQDNLANSLLDQMQPTVAAQPVDPNVVDTVPGMVPLKHTGGMDELRLLTSMKKLDADQRQDDMRMQLQEARLNDYLSRSRTGSSSGGTRPGTGYDKSPYTGTTRQLVDLQSEEDALKSYLAALGDTDALSSAQENDRLREIQAAKAGLLRRTSPSAGSPGYKIVTRDGKGNVLRETSRENVLPVQDGNFAADESAAAALYGDHLADYQDGAQPLTGSTSTMEEAPQARATRLGYPFAPTPQAAAALPPGTIFVDGNGGVRHKP